MTFHPETHVIATRHEGEEFVYTIRMAGQEWETRIKTTDLSAVPRDQRRGYLARRAMEARHGR